MNRRIGIPNVELRVEQAKGLWIIPNGLLLDGRLSRFAARQFLYPMRNVAADSTFAVKE
jgi:hypothetical protein